MRSGRIFLCESCVASLPRVAADRCFLCNRQASEHGVCQSCANQSSLDQIVAVLKYKGTLTEKAIHNFKFNFIEELAKILANLLVEKITQTDLTAKLRAGLLIPIPLHRRRFLERGFNQAELLAGYLSQAFGSALRPELLKRVKYTKQQATLDRNNRLVNLKEAFEVTATAEILGRTIFLVDDVLTSGATMNEAARALKAAGATQVISLVIAHG